MNRINRRYAVLYIDVDGDTLDSNNFTTEEMITDYYNNSGFLQWNFYLIISYEACVRYCERTKTNIDELIDKIRSNDSYTRKYIVGSFEIENYIDSNFPLMGDTGSITIVQGDNYLDSRTKALKLHEEDKNIKIFSSFYRDCNKMDMLTLMDSVRVGLLRHPSARYIFHSHISEELSMAERKFKLFIKI